MLLQPITVPFSKSTLKPSVYTLINILKREGPRTLPCGTPFCIGRYSLEERGLTL